MKLSIIALVAGLVFANLRIHWLEQDILRLAGASQKNSEAIASCASMMEKTSATLAGINHNIDILAKISDVQTQAISNHNKALRSGTQIMRTLAGLPTEAR